MMYINTEIRPCFVLLTYIYIVRLAFCMAQTAALDFTSL
jgi:hypothetical protein